jgi:ATP-binding cassette, subfamily B (MDR/TAP), member 1
MCIGAISAPLSAVSRAAGAAAVFYGTIDAPKVNTSGLKEPVVSANDDIILKHVNFTYITRPDTRVLHDISVTFPAGKTTAIVGPSGSGKSTIVALIQRWYDVGIAEDDPMAIRFPVVRRLIPTPDVKWWRSQIGLVQQEPFLFNGTIFENVAYGLIGTKWEAESEDVKRVLVKEACEEAFADEFISHLPDVSFRSSMISSLVRANR